MQIKTKIVSCRPANSEPVKQEVNGTVILTPLVFPDSINVETEHALPGIACTWSFDRAGNSKGGTITVSLTSCLTGLD